MYKRYTFNTLTTRVYRPLGYERVHLPLYKVLETLFHIQGVDIFIHSEV